MYDSDNIFAKILRGEMDCEKIYEDDDVLAFKDKFPDAPVHVLVVPKGEYVSFDDFSAKAGAEVIGKFFEKVAKIARDELGLMENGYRIVSNIGDHGCQFVPHFHVHILGGAKLGGGAAKIGK